MNKSQLLDQIALEADIPKATADNALNAITEAITKSLINGSPVSLVGFGKFSLKSRAARTGRNPRTGKAIKIPATNIPSFKAGKGLKDACK